MKINIDSIKNTNVSTTNTKILSPVDNEFEKKFIYNCPSSKSNTNLLPNNEHTNRFKHYSPERKKQANFLYGSNSAFNLHNHNNSSSVDARGNNLFSIRGN